MNVLAPEPIQLRKTLAVIRVIVGLLMVYHGQEVFNSELMQGYMKWDVFQNKAATFMVYAGKSSELIAGVFLTLGFLTRVGGVMLTGTMLYITFFVGHGRFWYEDQHPFMFVLFGMLFTFLGPGAWSLDQVLWKGEDPGK
jgi:putative oxidoreductase